MTIPNKDAWKSKENWKKFVNSREKNRVHFSEEEIKKIINSDREIFKDPNNPFNIMKRQREEQND